jgi:histidinol-phosphate aminotransferase
MPKSTAATAPGNNNSPQPLARVQSLTPYQQGKSAIPGHSDPIKLSSNECSFGPSKLAMEAFVDSASQLHRYPDGSQQALRDAIAAAHDIDSARIICGNGSEELIGLLIRCYVGDGDELLLPENNFVMCSIYGMSQGAKIVLAPEKDFTVDVDAMLSHITDKTRLISIANPNNPTGTYLPAAEMQRFIDSVPKNILIVLDGAYADYVDEDDYEAGSGWVEAHGNVVTTRTFSKIYGLAGLRIGWAYGPPDVIEILNRLRTPFNASGPAMAAAIAALKDTAHVERVREHNAQWLARISAELAALGVRVAPSVTNFYLLDFGKLPGKSADDAGAWLEDHGIIPRPGGGDNYLRITVGDDSENLAVLDSLTSYLQS